MPQQLHVKYSVFIITHVEIENLKSDLTARQHLRGIILFINLMLAPADS